MPAAAQRQDVRPLHDMTTPLTFQGRLTLEDVLDIQHYRWRVALRPAVRVLIALVAIPIALLSVENVYRYGLVPRNSFGMAPLSPSSCSPAMQLAAGPFSTALRPVVSISSIRIVISRRRSSWMTQQLRSETRRLSPGSPGLLSLLLLTRPKASYFSLLIFGSYSGCRGGCSMTPNPNLECSTCSQRTVSGYARRPNQRLDRGAQAACHGPAVLGAGRSTVGH